MFCITARGRFSKTLIFQAITSVDLSSGSNFTKGNDSLLSAFLRFSFVQEEGCLLRIPSPTNREWRKRLTPCHLPNATQIWREGSVVVSVSSTASTPRNIHTVIKHTFTQKTWKWEEPKPNQTFRRSKSKFKGIALFCELHVTVLYGNRRLRACLLKCCSQRQSGNLRSLWL